MGKFKDKIFKFMYGRYGTDQLYNFISIFVLISLALEWILSFFIGANPIGAIILYAIITLNLVLIIWSMFRCFSRNIYKRRRENEIYLKARGAVKRFFTGNTSTKTKRGPRDGGGYIYRDCTKCGNTLRLPYKAGKNAVRCPKWSHRFFVKAKKMK